jgi:hypothetical protein
MSKFKDMKFFIGGDKQLHAKVRNTLEDMGYAWSSGTPDSDIGAYRDGRINGMCVSQEGKCNSYFDRQNNPEINIDWMRSPKRTTVTIGDKEYYEDELAEALSKIKAVE